MTTSLQAELRELGQIVLVLQGGGALGAYQAGVIEALAVHGIEPDWVIGTSIGAINAALIAGSAPDRRLDVLDAFWSRVEHNGPVDLAAVPWANAWRTMGAMFGGVPNFFVPRPLAFVHPAMPLGADNAAYYSTAPLRETLRELVDFDRINRGTMRMTVGAVNVRTSEMRYFDSAHEALSIDHVMASGALPPAFPAVRIGDAHYWDGGIVSNTPVEAVFDDNPRRDSVVFAVHVWNPLGAAPQNIWQVMNRQKDIQYASRGDAHIVRQRQLHQLRHIISELAAMLPADADEELTKRMRSYGCTTRIHVLRLLAPQLDHEDHTKDVDFSRRGMRERWLAGYEHTCATLALRQWRAPVDPLEGFVLHETVGGAAVPV